MRIRKEIPSKWGPIEVDLVECDFCETASQEKYMINWCQLFPSIGVNVRTIGQSLPDELHFCGLAHMRDYLKEHVQ